MIRRRLDVVIDANRLVLLVVGLEDAALLGRHRRLRSYDTGAFDLLLARLADARSVVVTPGVLTEASNLLRYEAEPARGRTMNALKAIVLGDASLARGMPVIERYLQAARVVLRDEFGRLGLTDAGLLYMMDAESVLLTDDIDLYLAASRNSQQVEYFTYSRKAAGLL